MPSSSDPSNSGPSPASTTVVVPGRGRGRVVPRKGPANAAAAASSALVPFARPLNDAAAERALLLGQAPWRARRSLRSGEKMPRYSNLTDAATGSLSRGEPAVLANVRLSGGGGVVRAAAGASSSSAPATPGVTILTSAPGVDRFFELDARKNADPRGYYHVARPETTSSAAAGGGGGGAGGDGGNAAPTLTTPNLSEWLRRASTWTETRTLCRVFLGAWDTDAATQAKVSFRPNAPALRDAARGGLLFRRRQEQEAASASKPRAPLAPSDLLDWPRVLELLRAMAPDGGENEERGGELWLEACNPAPRSAGATRAAPAAALLPMRALPFPRVIVQVSGHRRVVLVEPSLTYGDGVKSVGVRPFPFAHPLEGYSSRGWEERDEEDEEDDGATTQNTTTSNRIRGRVAELAPGDALVIPAHWWAHQELLPPPGGCAQSQQAPSSCLLHAALELRLSSSSPGAAAPALSPGALRAQAARLAEGVLAASLGAPAVARCLEALASGGASGEQRRQQGQPLPPASVRAFERAVASEEAFELLVAACLAAPNATQDPNLPKSKGPVGRLRRAEAEARALCAAMAAGGRLKGGDGGLAAVGALAALPEGPPRRWLIEEDAEAARFPTLFRHRLLGAREDWREHAVLMLPEGGGGVGAAGAAALAAAALPAPAADADGE